MKRCCGRNGLYGLIVALTLGAAAFAQEPSPRVTREKRTQTANGEVRSELTLTREGVSVCSVKEPPASTEFTERQKQVRLTMEKAPRLWFKPELADRYANLFAKVVEWDKTARENKVVEFSKEIAVIGPQTFTFNWSVDAFGGSGWLSTSRLDASDCAGVLELLRAELLGARKELELAKQAKEGGLFK